MKSASCRRRTGTVVRRVDHFGDLITADHKILSEESESRYNHRYGRCGTRLGTQWLQSYSCKTKTSQETQNNLMKFLEPARKPEVIYTDNSLECGKSCKELSWNHCTSTPHRSETNGLCERTVRRAKEGTSAALLQSGLDKENIQDFLSDGKTPYERRFGMPFTGTVIPFGAMVEYHHISEKKTSRDCISLEHEKSLARNISRSCIIRGWNLKRRHYGRRH